MAERKFRQNAAAAMAVLLAFVFLLKLFGRTTPVSIPAHLSQLPLKLGPWQGEDTPIQARIVDAIGVDSYLNRVYVDPAGQQVELYVAFYANQRTDKWVHSPKDCIPGSGWEPIRAGTVGVDIPGRGLVVVNRYLIEKGLDHRLVFYWYQGRGRVMASEYATKFWLAADAMRWNRTDESLVRVITPTADGEPAAGRRLRGFMRTMFPQLDRVIPG
jgi:EpsI family protein